MRFHWATVIFAAGLILAAVSLYARPVGACDCAGPEGEAFALELQAVTFNGQPIENPAYGEYDVVLSGRGTDVGFIAYEKDGSRIYEVHYAPANR